MMNQKYHCSYLEVCFEVRTWTISNNYYSFLPIYTHQIVDVIRKESALGFTDKNQIECSQSQSMNRMLPLVLCKFFDNRGLLKTHLG